MKKSILLLLLPVALLAVPAVAQGQQPADDVKTAAGVQPADATNEQLLLDSIASLHAYIGELTDTIHLLLEATFICEDRVARLDEQVIELQQQVGALDQLSSVIFKQCLLYPLEARYSQQDIQDAIRCLNELGIWDNPAYKADCDVYKPMLFNYSRYNSALISLVSGAQEKLQQKQQLVPGYQMTHEEAAWLADDLRQQEYYPYYQRRNQAPYQSIIYLDDVIDNLLALLNGREPVTVQALNAIVEKLRPKQN